MHGLTQLQIHWCMIWRMTWRLALALLAVGMVTGCASSTPVADAPVAALPASNELAATATTTANSAPPMATTGTSLPLLLADIALAPPEQALRDLALDPTARRIFVTDTADQLHVIDAVTYQLITTLPFGGELLADPANYRLYVFKPYLSEDEPALIHVLDTTTLAEVGTLSGRAIAVDSAGNRLFVGEPFSSYAPGNGTSVRVVDGATLQTVREIPQPGAPLYNPMRDELLIAAYTLYTADPATGAVTGDLFPELTNGDQASFLWCNGCAWVDDADYDAGSGLIAVDLDRHCTGAGCGLDQPALFLDAATLAPLPDAAAPLLQVTCGTTPHFLGALNGRRYRNELYARYVVYTNFHVADSAGAPLTWREGLRTSFINPNTGVGYLDDGTVVDMATLTPVGQWPPSCPLAYDPVQGLLYGKRGGSLQILAERGGVTPAAALPEPATLDDRYTIQAIRVSPDYPNDATLLVELGSGGLLRSTDGGVTFMRLRGGLPVRGDPYADTLYAFFSPAYSTDRTIYVTGHNGETWGVGVWRSQDGGDQFAPLWTDLIYRRGQEIAFSPTFATDHALAVRAPFFEIARGMSGAALQLSRDGGLHWSVAVTTENSTASLAQLLDLAGLSWLAVDEPIIRISGYGQTVVATLDGSIWQTTTLPMPDGALIGVLPAPDGSVYVYGSNGIWRTDDGGVTWQSWDDSRLAGMTYENDIDAVAISPAFPDGSYQLFVGTADAQLWVLDPAELDWRAVALSSTAQPAPGAPVSAAPQTALRLPTPTPALTPVQASPTQSAPQPAPKPTTSAAPLTGEPPSGQFRPEGSLGVVWETNAAMQQALRWATQMQPDSSQAADQSFEHGRMIWVEQMDAIFVIYDDGAWARFPDTFEEGMMEFDPSITAPGGKLQPMRGFGKVWREQPAVRAQIGWALAPEGPNDVQLHPFERGLMLRLGVAAYALIGDEGGTWLQ